MANLLFSVTIPGALRGKGRHRSLKGGGSYPDPKTVRAEGNVRAMVTGVWKDAVLTGDAFAVRITAYTLRPKAKSNPKRFPFPTSKPDWDNEGKLVCDALNGIVWRDDAQIADGRVRKRYCTAKHPQECCVLKVYLLTAEDLESEEED